MENEEVFQNEHFFIGEENACSSHSLAVAESHIVKEGDTSDTSAVEINTKYPDQQTNECCDTLSKELDFSNQTVSCKPICEESNKKLTSCVESSYNQLESVDRHENGCVSDNECLSFSITDAIHDGENEYGEFDNTLRSIEELENSFIQVTLDGDSIDNLSSVQREIDMYVDNKDNSVPLTMSDECKNVCVNNFKCGKDTEMFNNPSDEVNDSLSLQLNNSDKVTDINKHAVNNAQIVSCYDQNEFDNNMVGLSKITGEPVSSDSTMSFKTCNTYSDSTIQSVKTCESAFSELQFSSSLNTHSSLVSASDHEISSDTERIGIINLYTNNKNTLEVLSENFSVNNSESDTNLQMCFDPSDNNKSEKSCYCTSDMSGLFTVDPNNGSFKTGCEKRDKICETPVHVELKNNAQKTDNLKTIYNPQDCSKEMQNFESFSIDKKTDFSVENLDSIGNIHTVKKICSDAKMCETETYEHLLDKPNKESILEVNVCELNEHTENVVLYSECEVINTEHIETDLKIQSNLDNIVKSTAENISTKPQFFETYNTLSNDILHSDNICLDLSEESCKTICNVNNSQKDTHITSNENITIMSFDSSQGIPVLTVNKNESVYELKDNSPCIVTVSSNGHLSQNCVYSNHNMTDLTKCFLKNAYERKENSDYINEQIPVIHVTNTENKNVYDDVIEKSLQEENQLDFIKYNEIDRNVSEVGMCVEDSGAIDISETKINQTSVIDDGITKQVEMECEEEPMDISYGDLSIKNTEQWKTYRLTIDDASLIGDIITETEFKEVLDNEEAIFNIAINKDGDKYSRVADQAIDLKSSLQKSNKKRVVTNIVPKPLKQQKSLIKTPLFVPKTDILNVQKKLALNLPSTKPSTAGSKNTRITKSSPEKPKLLKPSTAPKSSVPSVCREPKSQSKLKQENTVTATAKRKIELTKPASSPNSLKRNERFKQVESPIRAYINNSLSSMTSKISPCGNDVKSILENKISKQDFSKSTEKKASHIPMLRTPRLQVKCSSVSSRLT